MSLSNSFFPLVLLMTFGCSPLTQEQPDGVDLPTVMEQLEEKIPAWQAELNIPTVGVGLIEAGKISQIKVYGQLPDGQNAPANTLFNIASVTKVVFATLVMKLVENGDWDLDEPLYHYHIDPDVADDPRHRQLTARHVLSQQSGFVNWRWNHPTERLSFDFDPGTQFNYSGEGVEYLRQAIEKKFGQSLSTLADSLLFRPLKMTDTRHAWDGRTDLERFSYWYDAQGQQHQLDDYSTIDNAADDIMTTVADLTKFGVHVLDGAGLSPELFAEMTSQQAIIHTNMDQGLGWRVIPNLAPGDEYAIQHGGNDIGVATLLVLLPESKRGIVILTNSDAGIVMCNNIVRTAFPEGTEIIHRAYKSSPIDEVPTIAEVDGAKLAKCMGQYEQPSGRMVTIEQGDNSLLLRMDGVPNLQFLPESDTRFFLLDFDAKVEFASEENGRYQVLNFVEGENTISCQRIK